MHPFTPNHEALELASRLAAQAAEPFSPSSAPPLAQCRQACVAALSAPKFAHKLAATLPTFDASTRSQPTAIPICRNRD
jgi:hypothetical protein